jgi:hypothetical protein
MERRLNNDALMKPVTISSPQRKSVKCKLCEEEHFLVRETLAPFLVERS